MSIPYWPETLPQSPMTGLSFGPKNEKASFQPDVGEPVTRPRTTGVAYIARASFTLTGAEIAAFETFFGTTLAQGSKRFAFRDVIGGDVRMWRFMGTYSRDFPTKNIAIIKADMMMLPGVPWFAPYAKDDLSVLPYFVADYANDIYGIDGVKVAASDLTSIEGTYEVCRTVSGTTTCSEETLTAGDITETAPADTTLIVGYEV